MRPGPGTRIGASSAETAAASIFAWAATAGGVPKPLLVRPEQVASHVLGSVAHLRSLQLPIDVATTEHVRHQKPPPAPNSRRLNETLTTAPDQMNGSVELFTS